jgi:SAM-dependent methyltransferase
MPDYSNGYEENAEEFMRRRSPHIGQSVVCDWARSFAPGTQILELGCGDGVITEVLVNAGFAVSAVDASPTLLRAIGQRFPAVHIQCAAAEQSDFFGRTFDAAVAVGLLFLLGEEAQRIILRKVGKALRPGGRFLFTAPWQVCCWTDELTRLPSRSLGAAVYEEVLLEAGFEVSRGVTDEGENHYFFAEKPTSSLSLR